MKFRNKWMKYGITIRMILLFIALVIIPYLFLALLVFKGFQNYAIHNLSETTLDSMNMIRYELDNALRRYEESTMTLYYGGYVDHIGDAENSVKIEETLENICFSDEHIRAAYIKSDDRVLHGGGAFEESIEIMEPYEGEILEAEGKCIWYPSNELRGKRYENKYILARSLNNSSGKNAGILYLILDDSDIKKAYAQLGDEYPEKYLTDAMGKIIYAKDINMMGTDVDFSGLPSSTRKGYRHMQRSGKQAVIIYSKLKNVDWYCVNIIPIRDIMRDIMKLSFPMVLVSGTYIGFLMIMLYMMRRYIFKPLSVLKYAMDEYAQNDLKVAEIQELGSGEIRSLAVHFNKMSARIGNLMEDYKEEVDQKNRQRMRALSAQMTPHFIYNALNTIKWIAVLNKQDNIQNLIESLIYIFKNAARVNDDNYTIKDEITLIKNYAVIQKARFMNFELTIDVDDSCMEFGIRKFLLQPIVENAIVHGLGRGKEEMGEITLRVWRDDPDMFISVKDTGCGFDVAKWQKNPEKQENHTNIGLNNVKEMIELEYGKPYSLEIFSELGKGTTVYYHLPIVKIASYDKIGKGLPYDTNDYS